MSFAASWDYIREKLLQKAASDLDLTRRARRFGGASVACILLAMPASPASAGFFDFLFPPAQPARPAMPMYRPAPHFVHHRIAHVEHHKKKVALAHRGHKIVEAKAHPVAPMAVDVMVDESLRDGDAVMTAEGLRVFVGLERSHHTQDDFASVSDTEALSRRKRTALLAVAGGREGAQSQLVVGRSAAEPGLSAGVPIVDARGVKIRYVGP